MGTKRGEKRLLNEDLIQGLKILSFQLCHDKISSLSPNLDFPSHPESLQLAEHQVPEAAGEQKSCQHSSFSRVYTDPLHQKFLCLYSLSSKVLRVGSKPVHWVCQRQMHKSMQVDFLWQAEQKHLAPLPAGEEQLDSNTAKVSLFPDTIKIIITAKQIRFLLNNTVYLIEQTERNILKYKANHN